MNLVKGTPSDDEENRCEARNQSPCEPLNAISGDRFRTSVQRGSIHNPFQRTVGRRMRRSGYSALRFRQRTRLKFCFSFHFNRRTLFIFVFQNPIAIKSELHSNLNFYRRQDSIIKKGWTRRNVYIFLKILSPNLRVSPHTVDGRAPPGFFLKKKKFLGQIQATFEIYNYKILFLSCSIRYLGAIHIMRTEGLFPNNSQGNNQMWL